MSIMETAKLRPWVPPVVVLANVFMPITSPLELRSGPPLFPGLMAASV